MRLSFYSFTFIFVLVSSISSAQDARLPLGSVPEFGQLPYSLEQEEEAMILERHQARHRKNQQELRRELVQLIAGKQEAEEQLFYLQNQQQQSEGGQNIHSQELHALYNERSKMLDQLTTLLLESELEENPETEIYRDWEKASPGNSSKMVILTEEIEKLDSKIARYESAIPKEIDDLEELQEQIDETQELTDQLLLLQESNQALIKKLF